MDSFYHHPTQASHYTMPPLTFSLRFELPSSLLLAASKTASSCPRYDGILRAAARHIVMIRESNVRSRYVNVFIKSIVWFETLLCLTWPLTWAESRLMSHLHDTLHREIATSNSWTHNQSWLRIIVSILSDNGLLQQRSSIAEWEQSVGRRTDMSPRKEQERGHKGIMRRCYTRVWPYLCV